MEKIKKRQRLLGFLTDAEGKLYYDGAIDGIDGAKTQAGAQRFLEDYGFAVQAASESDTAEDPWLNIKYFRPEEFVCKCGKHCDGYPAGIDMTMVRYADAIRERLGAPLIVNSGLRCERHNANVGGVANSQHVLGRAADLGAPEGVSPAQMARIAEEVMGGTGGIGVYSWGIHIDSRTAKARWKG